MGESREGISGMKGTGEGGGLLRPAAALDRDTVAADWNARGFGCDLWVDPPGRCWEGFVHGTDELVMVLEGEMEFAIGGKTLRPRPGEEVLIPSRVVHSSRNLGGTTARWLYGYKRRKEGA